MIHAGLRGGNSCRDILHFRPSPQLQALRRARRTTLDAERRKTLSLQICKHQQREARSWKSEQLRLKLGRVVHWKSLRGMDDRFVGRRIAQQPSADDFAVMLQTLFDGKPSPPQQPALLTESAWTLSELTTALAKMKANKSGDDSGIVVALLQFASRIGHARGMKFFMTGMEKCNQSHWNMVCSFGATSPWFLTGKWQCISLQCHMIDGSNGY